MIWCIDSFMFEIELSKIKSLDQISIQSRHYTHYIYSIADVSILTASKISQMTAVTSCVWSRSLKIS